ncbi:Retrovirus-related Pol polyprotein from transposon [Trichinella spiralis]|uniref:Retrovirus-related Pol polyprotein from transposon n=1 Tax=Trichinella spiralis TaxID=6334 RepID=A0A0V1BTT9_TRISP|nr:Retrovirus-related Pol polyprotein from transposon [Trichinella spiralis]
MDTQSGGLENRRVLVMAGLQAGNTPCVNETRAVVSVIPESLWHSASGGEPLKREKGTIKGYVRIEHASAPAGQPGISAAVVANSRDANPDSARRLPQAHCVDYHELNAFTCVDAQPIPRIDDTLDVLLFAKWFSTLDLASGYCLLLVDESLSIQGHVIRPVSCQYPTDDGKRFEGVDMQGLLGVPRRHYRLRADRGRTSGTTDQGAPPPAVRGAEDQAIEVPADASKCIRRFVKNFAGIAGPLHILVRKGHWWSWASEQEDALTKLKTALCTSSVMTYPYFDRLFLLDVDASEYALSAVFSHPHDQGLLAVIAYVSRSLSQPEQKYCAMRRESMNSKLSTGLDHNTGTPMPYPEESTGSAGPRIQRRHARATLTKRRQALMQIHPVSRRFQRVGLDLRGPLEETRRGNRYILVVYDYFFNGQKHSHCLILRRSRVAKTRITAYHPQCDGMVERINQTLIDMLVKVSINQPEDCGYDMRVATRRAGGNYRVYVQRLRHELEQLFDTVRAKAGLEQRRQMFWKAKKAHGHVYKPGDHVWLQVPVKTKLGAHWD